MPYKDPEKARVCARESQRRYRAANIDAVRARRREGMRKSRSVDPVAASENMRLWRQENRDRVRAQKARLREQDASIAFRSREPWTAEEEALIARTDLTQRQMAVLIGRTTEAIRNHLYYKRRRATSA